MGILRTTLLALGAMVAVGATLAANASHAGGPRLVQATLDHKPGKGAPAWQ